MILCIRRDILPTSFEVNKTIDLGKLLLERATYLSKSELKSMNIDYVPINFMVSIRSAYSNLVLEIPVENSDKKRYYINLTNVQPLPHKGEDLIMYLASIGVTDCITYKYGFNDVMMQSQFCPVGLYNDGIINPTIYSTVVLKDDVVDKFSTFLNKGYQFVPISEMKRAGNIGAILDSLVIVKENENEPTSNDN